MEDNEKDQRILSIIRAKGPLLPIHIVKEIGWDTILVGAALSDLSKKGHIKMSNTKIGGSPVYYAQGQEHKLQDLYKQLHEKEQKAYDLLKEKKILKDDNLEPVTRVALRNIKDFAKPLEVTINNEKQIFWKWYLISNEEAGNLIKQTLKKPIKEDIKEAQKETQKETQKEEKKEEKEKTSENNTKREKEQKETQKEEKQESLEEKQEIEESSPFLKKIKEYFSKNQIEVLEQNIIRKTSDAEFIIKVPTSIGSARYFCKARSKKKLNDSDLSNAYVQGEVKKLPVLLLITGELTKKAESLLDEQFKNLNVKKI
jgi:hypothetical protein